MLNRCGTIEGEATIARTGEETFYLVTGAPSEQRVWDWLTLHCGVALTDAKIVNRSDDIGILTLAGSRARDVLGHCTDDDLSNEAFRWLRAREITVAGVPCLALRLSFTGELAWELHAPNDRLGALWDALWTAGQSHDIAAFGSKAVDWLRIEKFYRGGHELANDASHKDLDLMRFADLSKSFVGKDAMLAREPRSKIVLLEVADQSVDPLGGEAVYCNGALAGSVTSVGHSPTTGKNLVIAFLKENALTADACLEVSILGERIPAVVLTDAPYDAENERLRGVA